MRHRKSLDHKGYGHYDLHRDDPPSLCLDDVHERAPEELQRPREVKQGCEQRHLPVRNAHLGEHQDGDIVDKEIWNALDEVEGRDPHPRITFSEISHYVLIMLSSFQYAAWIVVQQDLIERVAFAGHHGGADLAEADSVSPSGSVKDQSVADPFYVKGGALEMGFGQPAADDQFLADDHCLLVADHLEPFEPSGRASLDRDEVTDGAEIYSGASADKFRDIRP